MNKDLRELIVNGETGITLNISAADLRQIVSEMAHAERSRIAAEVERSKERYELTRPEAARLLNISVATLDRMSKDGRLTPVKVGAKSFYRQSDIDKYNKENKKIV